MQIDRFDISGPVLFTPRRFVDERGYFAETFRQSVFVDAIGEVVQFVQDNQSLSERKGTIRGLHYQAPPHAQGKLVRCTQGAIIDVAVDIRSGSTTYGQHVRVQLSAGNGAQLWVPPGFLHGFATLTDHCLVQYKCTAYYDADCDGGVAWNDPDLDIDWGLSGTDPAISTKDAAAPAFGAFKTPF
ncbi:dTDP-4-dehydrorhamnose 3,5-epimerase [Algimonas porphyrae]|uniref:dTDP-4-dehydrorhamnose 3,5-epimerase n=1 Tax=Algimonas porphyrae TaxID=1128113 RepID=A0ABQ5UZ42_9PROT|nr:dTDP-4-dehydrorhamnose 3,5-epimerase [Algimonas porphyrae]GLQ20531.1 dTDP-4-dehydrorhamnose 3,5-epimerase [Algimonas porphyrae]